MRDGVIEISPPESTWQQQYLVVRATARHRWLLLRLGIIVLGIEMSGLVCLGVFCIMALSCRI
jgi:hypothetical protein